MPRLSVYKLSIIPEPSRRHKPEITLLTLRILRFDIHEFQNFIKVYYDLGKQNPLMLFSATHNCTHINLSSDKFDYHWQLIISRFL